MTGFFCTLHFLSMYCNFLFLTILAATRVKFNSGLYGYIVQMGTFYGCWESEIPGFYSLSDLSEHLLILKSTVFVCYFVWEKTVIWVSMLRLEGTDIAHHSTFLFMFLLPEKSQS